ncbi:MAG: tRNA lysidine(34) synthetase TilS [Endomicrobia bacterium]|nr:tRNA lysidine(34) synthetase TilS [Endomicrobiia bacterium]MCL2507112.1 tRNA lysidine(34) synthetase TilS [Endomicrobiia bacterium]
MKAWEIFYKEICSGELVKSGDKILLAVSGGPDSVCMTHLFWRFSKKMNTEIVIANFDHGLRKESKKESEIVRRLSENLKVKFITEKLDVEKYAEDNNISIETAGRDLRYSRLLKIAKENKCNKIATAHNANDNAETVLMWLLRGSGSFSGIPYTRKAEKNIEIIRPLLAVKRKDIEAYVKGQKLPNGQKLPFCIDKSNFSHEYTRNKIRHTIVPSFEKINPMAVEHIFSLSRIQAREDAFLQEISERFLKKCVKTAKNKILLDLTTFLRYNEAIRFRVLKLILPEKKYSFQINLIMDKILAADKSLYRLSSDWVFSIKQNKAVFENVKI